MSHDKVILAGAERVLVRTLPLTNANYGGVLQAYALQRVLVDLGLDPITDVSVSNELGPIASRVARAAVRLLPEGAFRPARLAGLRASILDKKMNASLGSSIQPFIDSNIATTKLYKRRGSPDPAVLDGCSVYLVGSDQVWRPEYGDVDSYLFDFVPNDDARLVSYAASFGRDDIEDFGEFASRTRELAQRFAAVSVREAGAVGLCDRLWGVEASHHIDPTLLLSRDDYQRVFSRNSEALSPQCLTYVLDQTGDVRRMIDGMCSQMGLEETLLARKPRNYLEWKSDPGGYRQPTVETWLRAFADAQVVVTDSFHGTVFAIINRKPFIAIANASRGASRFTSLLRMFGLERHLVHVCSDIDLDILQEPVDWSRVESILEDQRNDAMNYLTANLRGVVGERG